MPVLVRAVGFYVILLILDHLLPGCLGAWGETMPVHVRVTLVFVVSFLIIGISFVLYIIGHLVLYSSKSLVRTVWSQIETMAIVLHSGISKGCALSTDIACEVLPIKTRPLVMVPALQAWQWLSTVLKRISIIHTTPPSISWSTCKVRSAKSWNAVHESALSTLVLGLSHAGQAVNIAYATRYLISSLLATSARKVKSWLAQRRPAPITWDVSEMEIHIPTTDRRARLGIRALAQAYDMLLKSSEVFGQLNNQQKVDVIKHIAKDIIDFEKGAGHVYASRNAFFIVAQMIEFQCGTNRDHFELFARLKIGRVGPGAKEEERSIFAVFIYLVFMVTCGFPQMEQPRSMLDPVRWVVEDGRSEKDTKDPNAREQCAKATSEASAESVSCDSGYGGSP